MALTESTVAVRIRLRSQSTIQTTAPVHKSHGKVFPLVIKLTATQEWNDERWITRSHNCRNAGVDCLHLAPKT